LKNERFRNKILLIFRIIPILIIIALIVLIAKNINTLTISEILNYVPSNYFLSPKIFIITTLSTISISLFSIYIRQKYK